MITKILIAIGLRSRCCGAKIETWHAGKDLCTDCQKWLHRDVSKETVGSLDKAPVQASLSPKHIK